MSDGNVSRETPERGRTPTHGHTKDGRAVHAHTSSHMKQALSLKGLKSDVGKVEGLNAKIAVLVTSSVGTMFCAWSFCVIALISLPAILTQAGWVGATTFPKFLISPGLILIVAWVAQTFIQLVLLSIIMVGQSVQSAASDARASKTLEDTERALDLLDTKTEGGIKEILDAITALGTPSNVTDITKEVPHRDPKGKK